MGKGGKGAPRLRSERAGGDRSEGAGAGAWERVEDGKEGSPSTGSGWSGEGRSERSEQGKKGSPSTGSGWSGCEGERIAPGKNRDWQVVRAGTRKLFDEERKEVFLEWFAATANVMLSAEQAGVNYKTAFRHRMNDALFREAWDRALEQGMARQKAKLLETKSRAVRIGIEGDLDAPEMEEPDPQIVIAMLREQERRLAGYPKSGRPPRVATNEEVKAALTRALTALGGRVAAKDDAGQA